MLKRVFIFMLFGMVIAIFGLFPASNIGAQDCNDQRMERGECFSMNGYLVEIVPDSYGNFPQTDGVNSVFSYKVTGSKPISHIDALIPVCLGNPISSNCNPTCGGNPPTQLYAPGVGDPNTGFGIGLTTNSTFVWNFSAGSGTFSLTVNGIAYATPNAMLLNRGTGNYSYGQILSPSCGSSCTTFSPVVPKTIKSEVKFTDTAMACLVFGDESGCPTEGFTCKPYSSGTPTPPDKCGTYYQSVCDCPTDCKVNATDVGTFSDIAIPPGWLKQASQKNIFRCPMTILKISAPGVDPHLVCYAGHCTMYP